MKKISIDLPRGCREIMERIRLYGGESFAVGGAVRDALLGCPAGDFDIASSFSPEQIAALFSDKKLIKTGQNFGTVGILVSGEVYEVTTFRSDGSYSDYRRPDHVIFSRDIREDLSRRDFTVNAMAWAEATGLIDPFGGQADLEAHVLRTVGNPEKRFSEDALRIMRLLRFASRLSFEIAPETASAAHACKGLLKAVSGERLSTELEKLFRGQAALRILSEYSDVLAEFLEGFAPPERLTGDYPVDLALLFERAEKELLEAALERLRVSRKTRDIALFVHENLALILEEGRISLRHLLFRAGEEKAQALLRAIAPERLEELKDVIRNDVWSLEKLAVKGNDLETRGPETGRELACLLEAVMSNRVQNDKESLMAYRKEGK